MVVGLVSVVLWHCVPSWFPPSGACFPPFLSFPFSGRGLRSIVIFWLLLVPGSGSAACLPSFLSFLFSGMGRAMSSLLRMNVVETWFIAVWGLCWCNFWSKRQRLAARSHVTNRDNGWWRNCTRQPEAVRWKIAQDTRKQLHFQVPKLGREIADMKPLATSALRPSIFRALLSFAPQKWWPLNYHQLLQGPPNLTGQTCPNMVFKTTKQPAQSVQCM